MKTITKQVYYCDHCKKRSLAKWAMVKHEAHCTKNPQRLCNVCTKLLDQPQPNLEELKAFVRSSGIRPAGADEEGTWDARIPDGFTNTLRALAKSCPACMMAALRQCGIPVPMLEDFNFSSHMKAIWEGIPEGPHKITP